MNQFEVFHTEYLRPSRTIETVLVKNEYSSEVFFVYNYEGISFRVFKTHLGLINFFLDKLDSDFHFSSKNELDDFLSEVKLAA
ncbi:hypothetical protein [Pseudotamlana carrageenivorans]|nr:hypothetical protein [Tamlana carrageenivorans]